MADKTQPPTPDLEPRFLMPEGWRWHVFRTPSGRRMRFGTVTPRGRIPDAVVVGLPGLSEFGEKYFEIAHDLLAQNLSFWVIDWQGQGLSDRPFKNSQKRHSAGFDQDVEDLHFFILEYVKHASVHPDVGRIPLVMLAHSMGGNIGLRYLIRHPEIFAGAAFSAPMTGIQALSGLPALIRNALTAFFSTMCGKSYVFGGKDWAPDERADPARNIFSGDPVRAAVHNAWCLSDPRLQVGNITFGWLYQAVRSCHALTREIARAPIQIPCLFGLAGREKLVSNTTTRQIAAALPDARVLDFPDAMHEVMMERDEIRNAFLVAFIDLINHQSIKGQLKPF